MKSQNHQPLDWIRIELIPLPTLSEVYPQLVFWWNPDKGLLQGETELVEKLIHQAITKGVVSTASNGSVEITNPYQKPTELAAILGRYYWMNPQPVSKPFEEIDTEHINMGASPSLQ